MEIPIPVLFACHIEGLILLVLGGLGMGWKIYKTRRELQLKKGSEVKKLGKFYEKQQTKL